MKTILKNSWLILIAWSLILNSRTLIGTLMAAAACAYLLFQRKELNYWRICAVCMFLYVACFVTLLSGSIPYYFPELYIFLPAVCLDAALMNEYLQSLRKRELILLIVAIVSCTAVLAILISIVPEEAYLLFTKKNLFRMDALIFFPFLLPAIAVLGYDCIRDEVRRQQKGITM